MSHYYSEKQSSKSEIREVKYSFLNENFLFLTDNGVFSKSKVDFGSELMIKTFLGKLKDAGKEGGSLLDIGCGYGVVSIVVKTFVPGLNIFLSDVNERALDLAEENLKNNKINKYKLAKSDIYKDIQEKFDYILSNPPIRAGKETVFKIYEGAYEHLNTGGEFYCVIQTKHGAKSSFKKIEEVFGNCETLTIDGGYRILRGKKQA